MRALSRTPRARVSDAHMLMSGTAHTIMSTAGSAARLGLCTARCTRTQLAGPRDGCSPFRTDARRGGERVPHQLPHIRPQLLCAAGAQGKATRCLDCGDSDTPRRRPMLRATVPMCLVVMLHFRVVMWSCRRGRAPSCRHCPSSRPLPSWPPTPCGSLRPRRIATPSAGAVARRRSPRHAAAACSSASSRGPRGACSRGVHAAEGCMLPRGACSRGVHAAEGRMLPRGACCCTLAFGGPVCRAARTLL